MEKKLIEFKNIVKEFDGKLVLKGANALTGTSSTNIHKLFATLFN